MPNEFYNPWDGDLVQVAESLRKERDAFVPEFGDEFEIKELGLEELFSEISEVPLGGSTYYYEMQFPCSPS